MSDFHKEMLERMYSEIPPAEKAAFIIDMLKDLPEDQISQIKAHLVEGTPPAPTQAVPQQQNKPKPSPIEIQQMLNQGKAPFEKSTKSKKSSAAQFQLSPTSVKSEMRKELFLFILFAGLVLAVIVGMAVGAKHLWDLLRAYLGV